MATLIAAHLKTIPGITQITGAGSTARVLDFDYRVAGWNTSPVTVLDTYGNMRPTLVVDEYDANRPLFSQMIDGEEALVYVWAFGPRTSAGATNVDLLLKRTKTALMRWQEPTTRAMVIWTGRFGPLAVEDGVEGRNHFRVAGVPPREV